MKKGAFWLVTVGLLGILLVSCGEQEDPMTPELATQMMMMQKVGSEELGPPGIPIAKGSGIVAAGIGLKDEQPGTIEITVPGDVVQVLLYWSGGDPTDPFDGDDTLVVGGMNVTGTLIGGPTLFFGSYRFSAFRADITEMDLISTGPNSLTIAGMDFDPTTNENNGASVVVIYDDGASAQIEVRDGLDLAFFNFPGVLEVCVPQEFTIEPQDEMVTADLVVIAGSVADPAHDPVRPNEIKVWVDGDLTTFVNPMAGNDGPEWDTVTLPIDIPAGVTSIVVEPISVDTGTSTPLGASLSWTTAVLSVPTILPASLGDYVWEDENMNGIQDETDTGIEGVTVNLWTGCPPDEIFASTTTDQDGYYLFEDLDPGDYTLQFELPGGYEFSPMDQGTDDALDSDPDPKTGITECITLDPGEDDMTWDAGLYVPRAALGDYVWHDVNEDGIQDKDEVGVAGVTVNLWTGCPPSQVVASMVTDANGLYLFDDLEPGQYTVEFELPDGYVFSPQNQGGDDEKDSDADQTTGITGCITLDPGETDLSVDAGLYVPCATLGDHVWHDMDEDGIQDPGEPGIEGVTVNLWTGCPPDQIIMTETTDANGDYLFDCIPPGDYTVEFVEPDGYDFSPQDQGADDAVDSDADETTGITDCITLAPGETNLTVDAGLYVPCASLGDYVWDDVDRDGIQDGGEMGIPGVTVNLWTGCPPDEIVMTTTTDADGKYLFDCIEPGDYTVEFVPTGDYVFSPQDQGGDDAIDSDADPATGITDCITLDPGETDLTVDAGMNIPCATLGDYVWDDIDMDGIQDGGEMGIPGVTVNLWTGCPPDQIVMTTTTDGSGHYLFDCIMPGDYTLEFVPPTDYIFSAQDQGGDDAKDSDADAATGITDCITLDPGETDLTWDAGMYMLVVYQCRVTGGAKSTFADDEKGDDTFSCGGQAGAPEASRPQPWGEWTHTQLNGPSGGFTFHAGTASAPVGTEIDWIECMDPGWCVQARPAPAKQIDFAGVGSFRNMKPNVPPEISDWVTLHESLHWFEVNIDDLGEPGNAGKQPPPLPQCPELGFGINGEEQLADCDCPDFYRIRIYGGPDDSYPVIYEVYGYIEKGNFQIHPPTGHDTSRSRWDNLSE